MRTSLSLVFFICIFTYVSFVSADTPDSKSGVSPSVLRLPKGPGSLEGVGENVKVSLNMGTMAYNIGVKIPTGRNGMTPQLGLSYSSGGGTSCVGMGWKLSGIQSIERMTVRGLPKYDNTDTFTSGSGELVLVPGSPYYRVRYEGSFVRYRWHRKDAQDQQGYWTAEYPDGSIGFFGTSSEDRSLAGKVADRAGQIFGLQGTYRWYLQSKLDPNGNKIEYSYLRDGGQLYISTIRWVFKTDKTSLYTVFFKYQTNDRVDPTSDAKPGFVITTRKLLDQIIIQADGKSLRTYKLTYDAPAGLSRLTRVLQYGRDETSIHPIFFTMTYTTAASTTIKRSPITMKTGAGVNFKTGNIDLIDINGDGLPDIVDTSSSTHTFRLNQLVVDNKLQQKTHNFSQLIQNPTTTSAQLKNPKVHMLDVDGDGFTDLVDTVTQQIYRCQGNGRWESKAISIQKVPPTPGTNANARFFDYNGDKKIDVIISDGTTTSYYVGDGKGNWTYTPSSENIGVSFKDGGLKLLDLNGDHLQDAIQMLAGQLRYKLNLGWGRWTGWNTISVPGFTQSMTKLAQFADINGDALSDIVVFSGNSVRYFVNKSGNAFSSGVLLQNNNIPDSTTHSIRFADMNGNGTRDIVWINASGQFTYLELFDRRPNLLKSVHNNIGKWIEVTYGSSVHQQMRDIQAGKDWIHKFPSPYPIVEQVKTWATGPGGKQLSLQTQEIRYHNGYYDGGEKQFRGFQDVDSIMHGDSSTETKVETYKFDIGKLDPYRKGKLLEQSLSNDKGKIYQTQVSNYALCNVEGAQATSTLTYPVKYYCLKSQETTLKEGLDAKQWKVTRTEYVYDGYGNVIQTLTLGEKDKSGDEKYINTEYIEPNGHWFLRKPKRRVIFADPNSTRRTEEKYYYDKPDFKGMPYGTLSRGNLARTTVKVSSDKSELIERGRAKYDDFGNILEQQDANGNRRSFEWDTDYSRFPIKESVHLGTLTLTMSVKWELSISQIVESTSWNGHITRYKYDVFTRISGIAKPGDKLDKPTQMFEYDIKSPLSRIITRQRSASGGVTDQEQIQCFDGMGQKRQVRVLSTVGRYQIQGHVDFNNAGGKSKVWNPYSSQSTECAFEAPKETPFVQMFFDAKGRSLRQVHQDGSITKTVYKPFETAFYDEEDNKQGSPHYDTPKITFTNGLGHVLEVVEYDKPGHQISKKFKWDEVNVLSKKQKVGLPQLVAFTDADGNVKRQEHDLLGRVTLVKDPNTGDIVYTYDAQGNLLTRKDARGVTTSYTYDSANRLTSLMELGKADTKITFSYDNTNTLYTKANNLKGKLVSIQYPIGAEYFDYDERERLSTYRKHVFGHDFDFVMTYNNVDQLVKKQFPDGRILKYKYDAMNRMVEIPGYISEITFADNGHIQSWKTANGVQTAHQYDNRLRLKSLQVGQGKLLDFAYTYDTNGNFLEIKESSTTKKYTYDSLYRLTRADIGDEVLQYAYSDTGNILKKESSLGAKSPGHVGDYDYGSSQPYAVKKAGALNLSYDKAGNASSHRGLAHKWDFMGRRVETSSQGSLLGQYWYGAGKIRQVKYEQKLHTIYISPDYEIREGQAILYIMMNKQRVASSAQTASVEKVYDDIAPGNGDTTYVAKPDGTLNVADAMLAYHIQAGTRKAELRKREVKGGLAEGVMASRLHQLLDEGKEVKQFYHMDHLTSTRKVTDEKGEVKGEVDYYPYGAPKGATGGGIVFGYMNTELDRATNLNYAKTRYLDTSLGRWISADGKFEKLHSIKDEAHIFSYVNANPVRYLDPNGTKSVGPLEILSPIATSLRTAAAFVHPKATTRERVARSIQLVGDVINTVGTFVTATGAGAPLGIGLKIGGTLLSYTAGVAADTYKSQREGKTISGTKHALSASTMLKNVIDAAKKDTKTIFTKPGKAFKGLLDVKGVYDGFMELNEAIQIRQGRGIKKRPPSRSGLPITKG